MRKSIFKRLTAGLTALLMAFSAVPGLSFVSAADTPSISTVSDLSTIDGWVEFFGDDNGTENAGGIWVDKSVFDDTDLSDLTASLNSTDAQKLALSDDNNFIVALSALASTKSIMGYSYIPTDTVLVLDISGSMFQNISSDAAADGSRAAKMVEAANNAIRTLLANNNHNRVAVVLYSTTGVTFLPLDRYTVASETDDFLTFTWTKTQQGGGGGRPGGGNTRYSYSATISTGATLRDGNGDLVEESRAVSGGTYIQLGMDMAGDILANVDDVTVEGGAFQAGVDKMPIIVLMSDGAPTYGTASFTNVTANNRGGSGSSSDANLAFATQLTGAYTKYRVEQIYNRDALVYTLGVGVSDDDIATTVLNPANSIDSVINLWNTYDNLRTNRTMSISFGGGGEQSLRKNSNVSSADRVYVNRYFSANSSTDITTAFQQIVDQIVIQSKYYPTYVTDGDHHLDGDVTFDDDIGRYMEVKAIKGIVLGDTLFSGEALAHSINTGDLGTIANPTTLGDELVRAVRERLGVDTATARELLALAYNESQLYYDETTGEYSNYIGWYADVNSNFLGFWNGDDNATAPAGAVYKNKSYGFIGASGTGISASNMMYIGIQVHTNISTGNSQVIFRIPAALIPLITYEVTLEGTSYEEATNITVNKVMADPIRLVYEVGLRFDINELTAGDIVADDYQYVSADGTYSFYTNRWDVDQHIHEEHHPKEHINTIAYYTPSEENERYYYAEDTLIYASADLDSVYTGGTAPSGGTYYRAYYVFSNTANKDGIEATFVEISAESLAQAKPNDDGTWYIPKGVIHTTRGNFYVSKTVNPTSTYSFVREPVVGNHNGTFYATAFLGNNGLLKLDPAQGIKITKTIETVEPNTNTQFTFTIKNTTNPADSGEYRLIKQAADGTFGAEQAIYFTNGEATLTLNNGESAYIVDLETGDTFTVEEDKHDDYRVKSVVIEGTATVGTVATLTVAKDDIADAEFVNTYIGKGLLVISKTMTHQLGEDYVIPSTVVFDVEVDLGTDNAGKEYDTVTEDVNGTITNGTVTADASGKIALEIAHGMTVVIDGIAEDTEYTVTEADYSHVGFVTTTNGIAGNSASGTILEDDNAHVAFVNDYQPKAADSSKLLHVGTKTLSGREWLDTDTFEFIIEKFDGYNFVEAASVTVDKADVVNGVATFDFNDYLHSDIFNTAGDHLLRVSEVVGEIGGVTYSNALYTFTVEVSDEDMDGWLEIMDGQLDIVDVTSSTATIYYSRNSDSWEILTPFANTYAASGDETVSIKVTKSINDLTGEAENLSLEGYQFGLYGQSGDLLATLITNADGVAAIERTYTPADIDSEFTYTIKEIDTGVTGINYSDVTHTFTVKIVDNFDGTIGAQITCDTNESLEEDTVAVAIENVYEPENTSIILEGTKTLTGIRDMAEGEFDFVVMEGNTEVATGTNDAEGNIIFTEIEYDYTDLGEHTYTITETDNGAGGVVYDTADKTVVVNVTDMGGQLVATVDESSDAIEFTNEYDPDGADVIISATKHLTGRDLKDDDFDFVVTDEDGNEVATASNKADGTITFSFTEDEIGTHTYTITEVDPGEDDGVIYDTVPRTVTVEVTDNGEGKLQAAFVGGAPHIVFANTYSADGTSITLTGTKNLIGRDIKSGEFNFEVIDEDGEVVAEGVNEADNDIIFSPIALNEAGKFTYTVYELDDGAGGVDYSDARLTVVIEVTDDGEGNLVAQIVANESDAIVFTNNYSAEKTSIELTGTKTLTGRDMIAGEFSFIVTENGSKVSEGTNDAQGNITFSEIEYLEAGEHIYTITEVDSGKGGVTYDTDDVTVKVIVTDNGDGQLHASVDTANSEEIAFQNTYGITSDTKLTLKGTKVLEGRELSAGGFRFIIVGTDGTDEIVSHDADGNILFNEITYTEAGTYTYTITEIDDGIGGVTYDDTVFTVDVEVTDNGDGTLTAKVTDESPEVKFTNYYKAEDTSIILEGTKTLTGIRDLVDGEFEFIVTEDGTKVADGTNDIHGLITFSEIEYTEVGTHTYLITETNTGNGGVTFDTTTKTVVVNVVDNGYGKLVATVDESSDDIAFVNDYEVEATDVEFTGSKSIIGRDLVDGEFTFVVTEYGREVTTATNNAQGLITFKFSVDTVGTHTYVVSERNDGKGGVTYDTDTFMITVEVTDNGDGTLTASVTDESPAIEFQNDYTTTKTTIVLTGDKSLEGRDMIDDEFTFIVTENGTEVARGTNDAEGNITFSEIEYLEAGDHTYEVYELDEGKGGVTYDTDTITITVEVTDNGDGTLTASVTDESPAIAFQNGYSADDATIKFSATKSLSGRDMTDGEFTFIVTENGQTVDTATNNALGVIEFEFTTDVKGEHTYVVYERDDGELGMNYDDATFTVVVNVYDGGDGELKFEIISGGEGIAFSNVFTEPDLVPVPVSISGHKTLNSADRELKAYDFTFVLNTVDGEYVTDAGNLANGDFTIEFEIAQEGTFEYILTEDSSEGERGMTYDDSEYKIVITTAKNENYELYIVSQTVTKNGADAEVEFINSYVKPDTHAPVVVYKYLQGRDLVDGEFSFELYEANEQFEKISALPYRSATNNAAGIVDFGTLPFSEVGTYRFIVSEVKGGLRNVVYDDSEFRVTVVVTQDETTGLLSYSVSYADERGIDVERVLFKNNYKGGNPGAIINEKFRLNVLKQMVDLTDSGYDKVDGFLFKITELTTGKEYTIVSDTAGNATLEIEYTATDIGKTYIYEITEVNTGVGGVIYDESVHTVVVKIGYIPTIGKVSVYATKDDVLLKGNAAVFVNTYNLIVEDPVEASVEEVEMYTYN